MTTNEPSEDRREPWPPAGTPANWRTAVSGQPPISLSQREYDAALRAGDLLPDQIYMITSDD